MKRIFIAVKINLNEKSQQVFSECKSRLRDEKIKWVDPLNMHITLKFIGDTHENEIADILKKLNHKSIRNIDPFNFTLSGIGLFKNMKTPKIIWMGIKEAVKLKELNKKVNFQLANDDSFGSKKFTPHLTLGRIKYLKEKDSMEFLINKFNDTDFQDINVTEIIIFESKLLPKGPEYIELYNIPLTEN